MESEEYNVNVFKCTMSFINGQRTVAKTYISLKIQKDRIKLASFTIQCFNGVGRDELALIYRFEK